MVDGKENGVMNGLQKREGNNGGVLKDNYAQSVKGKRIKEDEN